MCGITGIISADRDTEGLLARGGAVQGHRGPDAAGAVARRLGGWNVGLGHQRLSIIDLTAAANQPMQSADGDGWLVYNGEIYNYKEIRSELECLGHVFRTSSDTEVALRALHQWGPEGALCRFNGMWAFAWLDCARRRLVLARDRAGEKPLHYLLDEDGLVFASEIKAVLAMADRRFSLNRQAVGEYLLQSLHETGPSTFFSGIMRMPPAHYAEIDLTRRYLSVEPRPYWKVPAAQDGAGEDESSVVEKVRELFVDSVRIRLRSDVPVGVLLSGGLDSSSIAAVMRHILGEGAGLNLISAVSTVPKFDESYFMDMMGSHLGCGVHKVVLGFRPQEAFDLLERVSWHNDEPVGSFTSVAHFLLMKQARELGVTVVLSGQGADELLCGYKKYLGFYAQSLLRLGRYAEAASVLAFFLMRGTVIRQFNIREAKRYLPGFMRPREMDVRGPGLMDYVSVPLGLGPGMTVQERQALDLTRFSVPGLTTYEDRMSMAWSREVRLPFLDHRLMEALLPLPARMKLSQGWTKHLFRKALEDFLPEQVAWRKDKKGFINPQTVWIRREMKKGVLSRFSDGEGQIYRHGLIDREGMLRKYEHYCRRPDAGVSFHDIFNPLSLEIWLRRFERYIS